MNLSQVKQRTQAWADRTRQTTAAFRLGNGDITFQVEGYPIQGKQLHVAQPTPQQEKVAA